MGRTSQEAVELDEQLEVDIVTLWRFAMRAAHMMLVEVDTCKIVTRSALLSSISAASLDVGQR